MEYVVLKRRMALIRFGNYWLYLGNKSIVRIKRKLLSLLLDILVLQGIFVYLSV
jgi:hypothetical protein